MTIQAYIHSWISKCNEYDKRASKDWITKLKLNIQESDWYCTGEHLGVIQHLFQKRYEKGLVAYIGIYKCKEDKHQD